MIDRIYDKYLTLVSKYTDVKLSAEKREKLNRMLMEEAIEFVRETERINHG